MLLRLGKRETSSPALRVDKLAGVALPLRSTCSLSAGADDTEDDSEVDLALVQVEVVQGGSRRGRIHVEDCCCWRIMWRVKSGAVAPHRGGGERGLLNLQYDGLVISGGG